MTTLRTPRLVLQPMTPDDIEWYAQFAADPEVMQYIGLAGPLTRAQAEERLERYVRCWSENGLGMFGVRPLDGDGPIGWGGLQPLAGGPEIEVGYAFGKSAWGSGFATELAAAVVRWGFEERGLDRIVAVASAENAASRRVMDKLGMHFEGIRPVYGHDSVYYSLTQAAFARAASLRVSVR